MVDLPGDQREENKSCPITKGEIMSNNQGYQGSNDKEWNCLGHKKEEDT